MTVPKQQVYEALKVIPADCAYETWYKMAAALYAALGEEGFAAFDWWSRQSPEKYPGPVRCRYQWEMSKRLTNIGPGTMFYYAKLGRDGYAL